MEARISNSRQRWHHFEQLKEYRAGIRRDSGSAIDRSGVTRFFKKLGATIGSTPSAGLSCNPELFPPHIPLLVS